MNTVTNTYNRLASTYEAVWSDYIAESNQLLLDVVHNYPQSFSSILDVGCGTGWLLTKLEKAYPEADLYGVDASQAMLEIARTHIAKTTHVTCALAHTLPFADTFFDLIVTNSSLHFWSDIPRSLRELRRVLAPRATCIIVDWHRNSIHMKARNFIHRYTDPAYQPFFSTQELATLVDTAGWEIIRQDVHTIRSGWGLQRLVLKLP